MNKLDEMYYLINLLAIGMKERVLQKVEFRLWNRLDNYERASIILGLLSIKLKKFSGVKT